MEPAAAWDRPCEFQLANWIVEEPVSDLPLPVEYVSIDIPGDCGIQEYEYDVQQLLVEFYSAASRRYSTSEKAKISNDSHARSVVNQVLGGFKADMEAKMMEKKMHRYPTSLGAVNKSYTVPRIVAIGPYHHGLEHLKQAEKVKHVAACHCIGDFQLLEEMYAKFVPVADEARHFYDKDVMAGISDDDFRHMMFFDACFLVQYMAMRGTSKRNRIDESLQRFLRPNRSDISCDIMLLENQVPWTVVETILSFVPGDDPDEPSKLIPMKFVYVMRYCMQPDDHREPPPEEEKKFTWYEDYEPPHLLGLLRYYIVGRSEIRPPEEKPQNMSLFISAMDLAEIGITLKANKTMQLIDMDLRVGAVFTELSLAPLSLDRDRASHLVNMVALELCTVESFGAATDEVSAVSSYLQLLANLVYREEDVQELRERGLLQRGGGLTNSEALAFFTSVQGLRFGPCYHRIMEQIKNYRDNSRTKTKLHAFLHNHKKTIAAAVTGIGAIGGIIGTLLSIKKSV